MIRKILVPAAAAAVAAWATCGAVLAQTGVGNSEALLRGELLVPNIDLGDNYLATQIKGMAFNGADPDRLDFSRMTDPEKRLMGALFMQMLDDHARIESMARRCAGFAEWQALAPDKRHNNKISNTPLTKAQVLANTRRMWPPDLLREALAGVEAVYARPNVDQTPCIRDEYINRFERTLELSDKYMFYRYESAKRVEDKDFEPLSTLDAVDRFSQAVERRRCLPWDPEQCFSGYTIDLPKPAPAGTPGRYLCKVSGLHFEDCALRFDLSREATRTQPAATDAFTLDWRRVSGVRQISTDTAGDQPVVLSGDFGDAGREIVLRFTSGSTRLVGAAEALRKLCAP
jgi:hypothetical protein